MKAARRWLTLPITLGLIEWVFWLLLRDYYDQELFWTAVRVFWRANQLFLVVVCFIVTMDYFMEERWKP